MLTRTIGRYLSWPIDRLAFLLARTGVPPNVITWSALALNLWACILFAAGRFAAAGGLMILAGLCDLLDGPVGAELSPQELRAARSLQPRWEMLADCGLPDTVVHGDFHPGNWRCGVGAPVALDFADAHAGNPVLDGLRAIDFLAAGRRRAAADAWIAAWAAARPRARPAEALRIAEPLAHLAYAVRYQEFLDNIEPSEHVYHRGDPAASIRRALACASALPAVIRGVYRRDCQAIPLSEVWRADLDDERHPWLRSDRGAWRGVRPDGAEPQHRFSVRFRLQVDGRR